MKSTKTITGAALILALGSVVGFGDETAVLKAMAEKLRTDPLMMPYYTGHILPTPQKVEYKNEFLPMANVAIVVGKEVVDPGVYVEVLTDRITRYGGQAKVVAVPGAEHTAVVSLGETELARQAREVPAVPDKEQGYLIYTTQAGGKPLIILKGRDRLGLTWSIASLMQLIHWRDGQTLARAVTVLDYPCLLKRGMILDGKGFFHPALDRQGHVVSKPDADLALRKNRLLMLVCKINEPCYSPLTIADCYSYNWKQPDKMPADAHIADDIAAMGRNLTPLGITWWGGLSPHGAGASSPEELSRKISGDEESVNGLLYFARLMEKAGGHMAILLDDIRFPLTAYDKAHHGTARVADTWFITRVMAQLKKEYPKARLLVCPPFYWGPNGYGWRAYGEDREEYLKTIGNAWPPEVEVFWSGERVNGSPMGAKDHIAWWSNLTKRKPYLWQNSGAYWCHMYRRHFPTDSLDSLWQCYWDGFMDNIGWYGFNGNDIARYGVTDAISADFQWNPQAYVKDKQESAMRSVREAAEKFIGQGSWPLLTNVTEPLAYFDNYHSEDRKAQDSLDLKAARVYDVLEAKRAKVESAFNILKENYPASVQAWSALEGFIGVADYANAIKANPNLRLYRTAVEQRVQAQIAGCFDPARDIFMAAVDISGGALKEVDMNTVLGDKQKQIARVLDASQRGATAEVPMTTNQAAGLCEALISARNNSAVGQMTLTLNGKTVYEGAVPFGKQEATGVRFPVPAGLANPGKNVWAITLVKDAVNAKESKPIVGGAPLMTIHYAVFKCKGGNNK